MNQQVRNDKYWIVVLFPDADFHNRAILFDGNAVKCERDCCPLVFLNTAVIVRVQICKSI